jgi:hypothetical protein
VSQSQNCATYKPERLAYWYFRLNGFLTIENFVVHSDDGPNQRTDADLVTVRFAHRMENLVKPMVDDSKIASCERFANVIIAEVKKGKCALNAPWTDPSKENVKRVLKAIGCVPESAIAPACKALYTKGLWSDAMTTVRIFCLGECKDEQIAISLDQQLAWGEVIDFCIKRFEEYEVPKSSVGQWPDDGRQLMWEAQSGNSAQQNIRKLFGLRPATQ